MQHSRCFFSQMAIAWSMAVTGETLRQDFLEFFCQKGHVAVPSASLLPASPNLLFTNAGMNAFVPYFLGQQESPNPRVVDVQKCIRAGGKHNDLEDVGFDTHHHTFFEMLGNWSFGDFFKREAIHWAWELLVHRWGVPKNRLHATVYSPGKGEPAEQDGETLKIWQKLLQKEGLDPEQHISLWGARENFWAMGDVGPCGPCTEIHMDLTPAGNGGALVNRGSPRCMELWNLVFIQYDAREDGTYVRLGRDFVDTGMGLERMAGILATTEQFQNFSKQPSNYDGELFTPLFSAMREMGDGIPAYGGTIPAGRTTLGEKEMIDCAYRVVADHVRALTMAIGDGILPGNEGRNYVLRRILRRAVLFARRLHLQGNYLAELGGRCIQLLSPAYPDLVRSVPVLKSVLSQEQETFEKTIGRGLQMLEDAMERHGDSIPGAVLFELYDTYGFPVDLARLIAAERAKTIDLEGFEKLMEGQRLRARAARKVQTVQTSAGEHTEFVGQKPVPAVATTLLRVLPRDGGGSLLVFAKTPFYGERGGQVGDRGTATILGQDHAIVDAIGGGTIVHAVDAAVDEHLVGAPALLQVDWERRQRISTHHSATHILQAALREILGPHVAQAGSLVTDAGLRFDFSHPRAVDDCQLDAVEAWANRMVRENHALRCYETAYDQRPTHCLAHFSESYGALVRVVEIGDTAELCGGTHVRATGEIGMIKILSEIGIAAGVRRIEAVAGEAALKIFCQLYGNARSMANGLHRGWEELPSALEELQNKLRFLEKMRQQWVHERMHGRIAALLPTARRMANGLLGILAVIDLEEEERTLLRQAASQLLARLGDGLVLLVDRPSGSCALAVGAGAAGLSARNLLKKWFANGLGRGGGSDSLASGVLADPANYSSAQQRFSELVGWPQD